MDNLNQDPEAFGAFGVQNGAVANLQKALTVGDSINPPGSIVPGDGFALRRESLEPVLHNLSWRMDSIKLFKALPKLRAKNTVEEHNTLNSVGALEEFIFVNDKDRPQVDDSTYERHQVKMKYMSLEAQVSLVSTLVDSAIGSLVAQETLNRTSQMLRAIERRLFDGDSSVISQEFDGYAKLIGDNAPAANIIDMRGAPLSEDKINDAALIIKTGPNYGIGTDLYCSDAAFSDLAKKFYPQERYHMYQAATSGMVGMHIAGFNSMSGPIRFNPDTFIHEGEDAPTTAVGTAPTAPTETVATPPVAAVNAASKFGADDAGTYTYAIVALLNTGRSAAVSLTSVAVAAGEGVTLSFDQGAIPGVGYAIYRTDAGGTRLRLIKRIATAGATTTYLDLNDDLPGTSNAYLFQQNADNMSLKQLAPFMRIPAGVDSLAIKWFQFFAAAPVLYSPGRNVLFKNVGRVAGSEEAGVVL